MKYFFIILDPESSVYVSEVKGSDENGDGSSIKPYKSILQVFLIYINKSLVFKPTNQTFINWVTFYVQTLIIYMMIFRSLFFLSNFNV